MNLYIFNKSSKAGVFGIGTYIRELTDALRHSDLNVCVVNIWSDKPQIQMEEIDGIRHWYFPEPLREQRTTKQQKQLERYHRNIVYLLQLLIEDKKDLIFHLNYMDCKPLAEYLKAVFDCKTVLAVHYLDSIITLLGNISRFRRIISQPEELTEEREIFVKETFLKEKELFHAVDKIICLANHAFDLLHQDYQIDKEKMIVIPNGLSDGCKKNESLAI